MLHPYLIQIILEVLTGIFLKKAAEIVRIHMYFSGQHLQRQVLAVMLLYILPGMDNVLFSLLTTALFIRSLYSLKYPSNRSVRLP